MMEAVNSVVSNAAAIRQSVSPALSGAMNSDIKFSAEAAASNKPFISPYYAKNGSYVTVLSFRDTNTGDVLKQLPAQSGVEVRQNVETVSANARQVQYALAALQSSAQNAGASTQAAPVQQSVAQSAPAPVQSSSSSGYAKAAIAAFSAGAQSGQASASTVSVTA